MQSFIFGLQVQIVCQIIEWGLYEQLHYCCRSAQSLSQRYSAHSSTKDMYSQEKLLFHITGCFALAGFSLASPRAELYQIVELT